MNPGRLGFVFTAAAVLAGWLVLGPAAEFVWGYFDPRPPTLWCAVIGLLLGGGGAVVTWKNPRVHGLANEVVAEVTKVTWPTRQETKWATIVVVITVIVASLVLAVFDAFWSWTTSRIYG